MRITLISELPITITGARQALIKKGAKYFVVSSVYAPYSGFETLVFRANEDGKITSSQYVAGGRGMSRLDAIADLAKNGES